MQEIAAFCSCSVPSRRERQRSHCLSQVFSCFRLFISEWGLRGKACSECFVCRPGSVAVEYLLLHMIRALGCRHSSNAYPGEESTGGHYPHLPSGVQWKGPRLSPRTLNFVELATDSTLSLLPTPSFPSFHFFQLKLILEAVPFYLCLNMVTVIHRDSRRS